MLKPWEVALLEYGTTESVGAQNTPKILQYSHEIGAKWINKDETPWCAVFVQWCLKQAGRAYSYHANARYFLNYGQEKTEPELGDLVILWRGSKEGKEGHVGFFIKQSGSSVYILGGNQNNQVNITEYNKSQVLGYREILDKI